MTRSGVVSSPEKGAARRAGDKRIEIYTPYSFQYLGVLGSFLLVCPRLLLDFTRLL